MTDFNEIQAKSALGQASLDAFLLSSETSQIQCLALEQNTRGPSDEPYLLIDKTERQVASCCR